MKLSHFLKSKEMINFAVVGVGHIGKRHIDTIEKNPNSNLVATVETNRDQLDSISLEQPNYTSIAELFANHSDIDIVNICTPNGLHSAHASEVLHQKAHVLIEKPMGLSSKECKEVIALADRNEKKAFCVMQNRYSPPVKWLKNLIDLNKLGEIYMVNVSCLWNRDERYYKGNGDWRGTLELDGGTLFTQFSHFIDMIYWVFGKITIETAKLDNFNHKDLIEFEDSGSVMAKLGTNTQCNITYSTSIKNKNFESSITVIGEKGTIKVGGQYMNEVVYCDIDNYKFVDLEESNPANDYGDYKGSANNHPYVIQNIVDVLNSDMAETTTANEGLEVVKIIEEIYKHRKI